MLSPDKRTAKAEPSDNSLTTMTPINGVAATSVWCATSPLLDDKGGVYCLECDIAEAISDFALQGMGQQLTGVLPWAADREMAKRLWLMSEEMTGVKLECGTFQLMF